jgi:hypothetical protein
VAVNRELPGPKAPRIYPDDSYRLGWTKVATPKPWGDYWVVTYKGRHVADLYHGKWGYIAVVFGKGSFVRGKLREATLHIAGLVINVGN